MHFLLSSEVMVHDIKRNFLKRRVVCPHCKKTQIKLLDKKDTYNEYSCWNKNCENRGIPFIIVNEKIENEAHFNFNCPSCQEPFVREFEKAKKNLIFQCNDKFCDLSQDPFIYNLDSRKWLGNVPKLVIYDDKLESMKNDELLKKPKRFIEVVKQERETQEQEKREKCVDKSIINPFCAINEIPLLSMDAEQYDKFLKHHDNKVVILVDVPNYVRTLRDSYPHKLEEVFIKSYEKLLDFINRSFDTDENYIIRYYSKPDDDLEPYNKLLTGFCHKSPLNEFFHMLKIQKSGHYSDIDNYLIANGVEILERCKLRGFVIVSSDKDYLPVMIIASHKKIRKYIYGINTADIYERYGITDIRILGMLNFFKK